MKRIIFLAFACNLLVWSSCKKTSSKHLEDFSKSNSNQYFSSYNSQLRLKNNYTLDEFINSGIGEWHNEGCMFVVDKFINSELFSKFDGQSTLTTSDSLLILKFIQTNVLHFLNNSQIKVDSFSLSNYYVTWSDEQLLSFINYKSSQSPSIENYFIQLKDEININDTLLSLLSDNINTIRNNAAQNLSTQDFNLFSAGCTVAIHSSQLWNSNNLPIPLNAPPRGVIVADATGAINGGAYGLAAGPIGAVAVGVSGALIGSCSSYLLDKIWDKIFS